MKMGEGRETWERPDGPDCLQLGPLQFIPGLGHLLPAPPWELFALWHSSLDPLSFLIAFLLGSHYLLPGVCLLQSPKLFLFIPSPSST